MNCRGGGPGGTVKEDLALCYVCLKTAGKMSEVSTWGSVTGAFRKHFATHCGGVKPKDELREAGEWGGCIPVDADEPIGSGRGEGPRKPKKKLD